MVDDPCEQRRDSVDDDQGKEDDGVEATPWQANSCKELAGEQGYTTAEEIVDQTVAACPLEGFARRQSLTEGAQQIDGHDGVGIEQWVVGDVDIADQQVLMLMEGIDLQQTEDDQGDEHTLEVEVSFQPWPQLMDDVA